MSKPAATKRRTITAGPAADKAPPPPAVIHPREAGAVLAYFEQLGGGVAPPKDLAELVQAVQEAMRFYKLPPERLIVLSDDISLPVGKMRIRTKGSAGGHNGLKDIILKLSSDNFPRIKFGVGAKPNPEYDLADWVLGQFTEAEGKALYPLLQNTAEACTLIMQGKPEEAMSRFN